MEIIESGSAIKGPYKDFNNTSYSTSALKNKYREYKKKEGMARCGNIKFETIWRLRNKHRLTYLEISEHSDIIKFNSKIDSEIEKIDNQIDKLKKNKNLTKSEINKRSDSFNQKRATLKFSKISERKIRTVVRFLENENSVLKDILAGYKTEFDRDIRIQQETNDNLDERKKSYHKTTRPSGSRTILTNDQVLLYMKECNNLSMREISKQIIDVEGSLDSNNEKDLLAIHEKIKNISDRLDNNSIRSRVNTAITQRKIRWSDGKLYLDQYSYKKLSGPEKLKKIALKQAQETWLPEAIKMYKKGMSSRKISAALKDLGYVKGTGKTNILEYIRIGYIS